MGDRKPAIAIAALPGRRARMIEYAQQAEQRGFTGVYVTSVSACLPFCQAVLEATSTLIVGSSIQPIYFQSPRLLADNAAFMHEVSGGRFRLGIGISHAPALERYGVANTGKPVTDMRNYVAEMRGSENEVGPLPPIVLATLRDRMLDLACEIGDGSVWANGPRETVKAQLAARPRTSEEAFSTAAMVPTVIDDDIDAARNVHRKTLSRYVQLPNYRAYWKASGFEQEMTDVEDAIAAKDLEQIPSLLTDAWLDSTTLSGPPTRVRDGIEAWFDAGIKTPIIVPSAIKGGQAAGIGALFDLYG